MSLLVVVVVVLSPPLIAHLVAGQQCFNSRFFLLSSFLSFPLQCRDDFRLKCFEPLDPQPLSNKWQWSVALINWLVVPVSVTN